MPFDVDTPGDCLFLNNLSYKGQREEQRCVEWDKVKKIEVRFYGITYGWKILCPPGCVKSADDVRRKCGIKYFGDLEGD